jgi:hypothetical protein
MSAIILNASSFASGFIACSAIVGSNTTSISNSSNTQINPLPNLGISYSSQLFYNSLNTANVLPITGSFSPGTNIQTITANNINAMTTAPNPGNFYFQKSLLILYYSNQTYNGGIPLPNAFITPAPPGGSLNTYGGLQITTTTFIIQPCGPPTLVSASNYGNGEAYLAWNAPTDDGGSPITNYLIQYRNNSGPGAWNNYAHPVSTSLFIIITGLTIGITYDFQVSAVNGYCTGVGPTSGLYSNILSLAIYTIPTQPTNLTAITQDGGYVYLSWNPSTTTPSSIITYTIQYKVGGFGDWMKLDTTTNTFYTILNFSSVAVVNNSVKYCFQVYATNIVGDRSAPSNIAEAMPFNNSLPTHLWSRFEPNCPSFKVTENSVAETSYDQQRKANILQRPENGRLNFTKAMLWSMAARNQLTRKKGWASQSDQYTYPNTTNIDNTPDVGLKEVNNTLTCWKTLSPIICNSSTASNVPGKPVILCYSANLPFNNYRQPQTYASGGTKWPFFTTK